jgi:ATP-binding cassette subfamily C (CFTR/MRP) protein 1
VPVLASLVRLMEVSEGGISIDGVDISTVGLTRLRNAIAVIGQDAQLFVGSLRYNLDPLEQYDDARLNDVLKQVGLGRINGQDEKNQNTTPLHLDFDVAEDGSNLSQGQRALVSIARALIKKAKIVLIDEATASVDQTTDAMIQDTFEQSLRGATVLTVAHRLHTVIGASDRVCVMSNGVVAELGSPMELYENKEGIFRQLCESASIDASFILREREKKKDRTMYK